jgi:hypothetical protein
VSERRALLVCNWTFRDPALANLKARDAPALARALRNPAIGGFKDVRLVSDKSSTVVRTSIAEFFAGARPDDFLLLYVATHGHRRTGRLFLTARDTRLNNALGGTALEASTVFDAMEDSLADGAIAMIDCCFSGAFVPGRSARGSDSAGGVTLSPREEFSSGSGRAVMMASRAYELAFESADSPGGRPRSQFAAAIIDGLNTGDADCDHDGVVSFDDLFVHVRRELDEKQADEPMRQSPTRWLSDAGRLIIARNPAHPANATGPLPRRAAAPQFLSSLAAQALELLGGDLGNEVDLANRLGVSRQAALRALDELKTAGQSAPAGPSPHNAIIDVTVAIPSWRMPQLGQVTALAELCKRAPLISRWQASAKSSDGTVWLDANRRATLDAHLALAQASGLGSVLSLACHEDRSNTDPDVAACEATAGGAQHHMSRICPLALDYRARLVEQMQAASLLLARFPRGTLHLSYFRFLNLYECVCVRCLKQFADFREQRDASFTFSGLDSLLDPDVLPDWVEWRQQAIAKTLREMRSAVNVPLSLEIDFDQSGHYLAGPEIDEGLKLEQILPSLDELYIHIHELPDVLSHARKEHVNQLRYIISRCKVADVSTQLFFWSLKKERQAELARLADILSLTRAVAADGVVLYTEEPQMLLEQIATLST